MSMILSEQDALWFARGYAARATEDRKPTPRPAITEAVATSAAQTYRAQPVAATRGPMSAAHKRKISIGIRKRLALAKTKKK